MGSSIEFEYCVIAITTVELLWLHSLFSKMQLSFPNDYHLSCDNLSAISLEHIHVLYS